MADNFAVKLLVHQLPLASELVLFHRTVVGEVDVMLLLLRGMRWTSVWASVQVVVVEVVMVEVVLLVLQVVVVEVVVVVVVLLVF